LGRSATEKKSNKEGVNAVSNNNHCSLRELYETRVRTVWERYNLLTLQRATNNYHWTLNLLKHIRKGIRFGSVTDTN